MPAQEKVKIKSKQDNYTEREREIEIERERSSERISVLLSCITEDHMLVIYKQKLLIIY